jgi:hypothetical protein
LDTQMDGQRIRHACRGKKTSSLQIFLISFYSAVEFCDTRMRLRISCLDKKEGKRTPKTNPIKICLRIIKSKYVLCCT